MLLYCWHAYSVRIGTGLWFASMNYSVHALMYFYFGVTQTGPAGRKLARKFSMLITSLQLMQMVMGIVVTASSVVYHARGEPCYVNLTNSFLGLAMYSSYFVLFLQVSPRPAFSSSNLPPFATPLVRYSAPPSFAFPAVAPSSHLPRPRSAPSLSCLLLSSVIRLPCPATPAALPLPLRLQESAQDRAAAAQER